MLTFCPFLELSLIAAYNLPELPQRHWTKGTTATYLPAYPLFLAAIDLSLILQDLIHVIKKIKSKPYLVPKWLLYAINDDGVHSTFAAPSRCLD